MVLGSFAVTAMLTKNSFLEEIRKQYVLTARAKGLGERQVLWKHVFRNALIPIITGFPAAFIGAFFTGSLLIETLFSLDGLGLLSYESVIRRDYPVVLGTLYLFTLIGLVTKLISDLCYVWVDPRVKFRLSQTSVELQPSCRSSAPRRTSQPSPAAAPGCASSATGSASGASSLFASMVVLSLFAEVLSTDRPLIVRYEGQDLLPGAARLLREDLRRRLRDAHRLPRSLHPRAHHAGRQLGDLRAQSLRPEDAQLLRQVAQPGRAHARQLARHRRPRPRPAGAADLRLPRERAVRAGADRHRHGAGRCRRARCRATSRGKTDLAFQRFIEIWGSMPELYLLIIFSAIFAPSVALLLILLSLFGWMGLSDYVRAEFLRNRQMDYVRAARALGVGNLQIMWRHILPNSMTPVVTFLPFRMSAAILALTSLDFLGLGVPPGTPSLGELLSQGKANIDAWWISISTFGVLVVTLMLLTFMGDALRDALDPRKADQ